MRHREVAAEDRVIHRRLAVTALPLTALNNALRGVMLQGTGLTPLLPEVAVLAAWGIISFALALKFFRWQ